MFVENCSVQKRTTQPNKNEPCSNIFTLNKKSSGKHYPPSFPYKKQMQNIFSSAPSLPGAWVAASLRFPASIFRRFPRGALPTRPCHSFVHRSQTQLGDGADGWGSLGWWEVGSPDAPVKGYGILIYLSWMT